MLRFVTSRLLQAAVTVWIAGSLVFLATRMTGSPEHALLPADATLEQRQAFRQVYGLDQPLLTQYWRWASRILQGDLGKGTQFPVSVLELIWPRLINSLKLAAAGVTIAIVAAVPLGVLAATSRHQFWDRLAMLVALGGQSLPSFWLALILVLIFSVKLQLLPATGCCTWRQYLLPSLTLSAFIVAGATRLIRSAMLEVLDAEFIKLARTKGLSETVVVWKHALRNAILPAMTFVGLMFGVAVASSITTETIFVWPGMGRLVFEALVSRDFPVIQGVVLVWSVIIVGTNLLVDLAYGLLDPRVRTVRR